MIRELNKVDFNAPDQVAYRLTWWKIGNHLMVKLLVRNVIITIKKKNRERTESSFGLYRKKKKKKLTTNKL